MRAVDGNAGLNLEGEARRRGGSRRDARSATADAHAIKVHTAQRVGRSGTVAMNRQCSEWTAKKPRRAPLLEARNAPRS